MSGGLSNNIKNGQRISVAGGSSIVNINDVVEIGGPGNEAWTVATADYAAIANAGIVRAQTSLVAAALPAAGSRMPAARDRLGNIYIVGTNSSGYLVAYKYSAAGVLISSATLDANANANNNPQMFQLQSGAYACVYARAAGALYFVIFDAALTLVAGPSSVGTERTATNVVYHSACVLTGGGFAIAFQTSAGTAINLVTYSNTGAAVQTAISIATLAGGAAQEFLKLGQISNGNLVCAFRGTMTAGGIAGTSFVVVSVAGAGVVSATNLDTTATLGFLELDIEITGFFAIAVANGTNLICGVYSNAGAVQGTPYSVGNTLNSTTYPQTKLTSDSSQFWLAWFSSAANGLYVVPISTAGVSGAAGSGLGVATLSASTYALDARVINGLLVVLAASSATAGQYWMSVALPDASLGTVAPYVRTAPTAFGTAAGTTGTLWPRVLSGGGGLYTGTSPPTGQPVNPTHNGDFTAIFVYDQQSAAATLLGIQKVEASAVVGVALSGIAAGQVGVAFAVNPGQGEYPSNAIGGTSGVSFSHVGSTPAGTAGALFNVGVALTGMTNSISQSGSGSAGPIAKGLFNGSTGALISGFNMNNAVRTALGKYTITMTAAAANASYVTVITAEASLAIQLLYGSINADVARTSTSFAIGFGESPTGYHDPVYFDVLVFA